MPITLYDKQGKPTYLDEEEAHKAVAEGRLGFAQPSARLISPTTGASGEVPLEEVNQFISEGYRLETDDERTARMQSDVIDTSAFGTAGAGAASALALSDVWLGRSPMHRRVRQEQKAEHPIANIVGEMGGTAIGLATGTGVPGLIGKVGTAAKGALPVATSLLGRAGVSAVTEGAQGTLYGLGHFISEQGLSDKPGLDAEKLFAAMGGGMLAGGLLGGGGVLAGAGLAAGKSLLMQKFGGQGLRSWLDSQANKIAIRQWARQTELKNMGLSPSEIQEIGDYGLKKGFFAGAASPATAAERAAVDSTAQGNVIGRALAQTDRIAGNKFDVSRFAARATQEILDPMTGNPALKDAAQQLGSIIKDFQQYAPGGSRSGKMSFTDAWKLRSDLLKKTGMGEQNFGIKSELAKLQRLMREEILDQAGRKAGPLERVLKGAARRYRNAETIQQLGERAETRFTGNMAAGLPDMFAGVGVGLATGNPLAGIGSAAAFHLARERGGSLIASTLKKLAGSGTPGRMSKAFYKYVRQGLDASPIFGGAIRAQLERAAAEGDEELLGTYVSAAQADPSVAYAIGLTPEDPSAVDGYAAKADKMEILAGVLGDQDAKIDQSLDRFFGQQGGRAPQFSGYVTAKDFKKQFAKLEKLVGDTQSVVEGAVPPEVAELSPAMAALMGAANVRAMQFLYNVAPKPPRRDILSSLSDEWEPSAVELDRWGRYVEAVERPDKVIADARSGTIMQEQVDAMRVVYPQLMADLSQRMLERVAGYDKNLQYGQRFALARFLGAPMGGAGDPQRLALLQHAHAATVQQSSSGQPDGRQQVSVDRNIQTQAQRIEGRGGMS